MEENSKVQVAVRLRPMNKREIELGTKCVVDMEDFQTILYHPDTLFGETPKKGSHVKHQPKTFAFDHCFWSVDESNKLKFKGQKEVFDNVGMSLLKNAFAGYNACIFAYGQTGSGKSYTMMGTRDQKGIIPQLCDALFEKIEKDKTSDEQTHTVEVSYMEIYNEKVHDLLDTASKGNLKVREHNILGPYVDGLSQLAVNSYEDIENLMVEGNKSRTVAATNMNSESSRSHAVFTIKLTQTLFDKVSGVSGERVSKISLVDLAGSERVTKTGAIGERLKEGSNINKSLTTLGLVIKALAEASPAALKSKKNFVPYRDSVLTWLLKDNLGGNSKTVMIATISPAADNYEETLSTLRYADSAKRIVNHAVVNEDPNAKIIRELRTEVEALRSQLAAAENKKAPALQERLEESEKLIEEMSKTWEEKLQETERIHKERQQALENMGVSIATSGIKVESDRCFLVNLNADPSLNELLVYYLKDGTIVGSGDEKTTPDIQLLGLGILPYHCVLNIENGKEVYITPIDGSRTFVNGSLIHEKTRVRHGYRILWGNNHFFRLNIPKKDMMTSSTEVSEDLEVDYDFAQQEIMQQAHDPIQESIEAIERQYENDKNAALDAQRQMYEEQMSLLKSQLSSSSPQPWNNYLGISQTSSNVNDRLHRRIQQMAHERNSNFKQSLTKLKEELVRVNMFAREANELSQELNMDTKYNVTLQIPASNLSPNGRRGALMSEPAILARNESNKTQVFSMDEFESQLVLMREVYQERKNKGGQNSVISDNDNPFHVDAENHNLIGVANVFLDALFYDVQLDYYVAIINQQGEVTGRLHVELCRIDGSLNDTMAVSDDTSVSSEDSPTSQNVREITVKVSIKEAKGLPPSLSNFVFCRYKFWGQQDMIDVAPKVDENILESPPEGTASVIFDHHKEFIVPITEEFTEHLYDGALSIEVYGHPTEEGRLCVGRSLADRWSEVTRKLEMSVEIQELSPAGEYEPVEVQVRPDIYCGGVFQLRQGFSRRILVKTRPLASSGLLPLTVDDITSVAMGGLVVRSLSHKGLDSYQEDGLALLRSRWNEALEKRRSYLDDRMQLLAAKEEKTESDIEREKNLMNQWLALADERNNVLVPQPGSGVPGAPASGEPALGLEHHCPVIFLDLNIEDMVPRHNEDDTPIAESATLDKEIGTGFATLPIIESDNAIPSVIASWDTSIHNSLHLNRVTQPHERIYMTVKAYVKLSHPAALNVTLRKRICINIYKTQSFTDRLKKKINTMGGANNPMGRLLHVQDKPTTCGVLYDIVSSIPKASEELEDRETMAKLAASSLETQISGDGESYIEKYIKSVAAVESIITLDRLGQEVAIKDLLLANGKPPRRTFSSPNISALMRTSTSTPSFTDRMKSPLVKLSESFQDISRQVIKSSSNVLSPLAYRNGVEDSRSKPKLPGSGQPVDSHLAADEGYCTTPRTTNYRSKSPEPGENFEIKNYGNSRKALDFDTELPSKESPRSVKDSELTLATKSELYNKQTDEVVNDYSTFHDLSIAGSQQVTEQQPDAITTNQDLNEIKADMSDLPLTSNNSDPELTPTKQIYEVALAETSPGLPKIVASLANVDSDVGTPDNTPVHMPNMSADVRKEIHSDDIIEVTSMTESVKNSGFKVKTRQSTTSDDDFLDDEAEAYNEDTPKRSSTKKTRAEMLNDIYSMNALDELEALGDSMESLNSSCSTDDAMGDPAVKTKQEVKLYADNKVKKTTSPALLVDDVDSDLESDDEIASTCSFGSTADLNTVSTPMPPWIEVGAPVIVLSNKGDQPDKGYVRYIGETDFAPGTWVGVQLDSPKGKNNGTVQAVNYFECKQNYGVFVRHDRILLDKKRSKKTFAVEPVERKSPKAQVQSPSVPAPSYLKPTLSSRSRKS